MFVGDMLPRAFGGDPMALGFQKSGPRFVFPEYIQIPWGKSGQLLREPKWLPSFELRPYVRKLNGEVYIADDGHPALQYWQDPGGYWRMHLPFFGKLLSQMKSSAVKPPSEATAEDVNRVLRRLGYPV
ncbi:hypothetical protein V2G26_009284 [Clonostachys chloroleuca]